ncbi:MAG TPA: transposase [Opitutaceae bacterium]|nr:transposase [Opitutaceae bacterium]
MREPRIKVSPEESEAIYHCMTRTVNGEWLFTDADKEMLRRLIWLLVEFCGLELLSYAIMSNHFHVLVWGAEGDRLLRASSAGGLPVNGGLGWGGGGGGDSRA